MNGPKGNQIAEVTPFAAGLSKVALVWLAKRAAKNNSFIGRVAANSSVFFKKTLQFLCKIAFPWP